MRVVAKMGAAPSVLQARRALPWHIPEEKPTIPCNHRRRYTKFIVACLVIWASFTVSTEFYVATVPRLANTPNYSHHFALLGKGVYMTARPSWQGTTDTLHIRRVPSLSGASQTYGRNLYQQFRTTSPTQLSSQSPAGATG